MSTKSFVKGGRSGNLMRRIAHDAGANIRPPLSITEIGVRLALGATGGNIVKLVFSGAIFDF
jgi:hypothetical protein